MKKYDELIKNVQKIIALNEKQNELYYQMLQGLVIQKHHPEGGLFALINKDHYRKNYLFGERYKQSAYPIKGYKHSVVHQNRSDEDKEITYIINLKTYEAIEEKIIFPFDRKVVRVVGKNESSQKQKNR